MQRTLLRNLLFLAFAILLLGASMVAMRSILAHAALNQRVSLTTQAVPLLQHAQLLHAADSAQALDLSIGLQLRDQAALDTYLQALYDPRSPYYHQYLTPEQFNQLFAPTSAQVQQVTSYLQSQGFTVTGVSSNHLLIDATSSVAQAQQSFQTQINTYRLGMHTFYANSTPPSIPAALSTLITSISGLDNSAQYRPLYQQAIAQHVRHLAGPSGLTPQNLASAYDLAPLQNSGILGDNQTVALFELDGYQQSDLNQYFQQYGLNTPNISRVLVDNATGAAGQGAVEAELDIEVMAGIVPHAAQIVYEGPNTTQGLNDTYNRIVADNKAQVVSISWGMCEAASGNAELQTLDNIFKQGVAQGMTFVAAAGDSGAYDCQNSNLGVDSPASDPYVTGVGATSLQMNNGTYSSELVWSNPSETQRGPKGAGSGGGLSSFFKQQSWQVGLGVQNQYANGMRQIPDVTAVGDPTTGYSVYCTVKNAGCPATGWMTVGGTSASTPLWAATLTALNQYLQAQGKARLGFANPSLYAMFNVQQQYPAFHDVVAGNNLFYQATAGYDEASGIGSPDAYNLARDLVSPSVGGLLPPPTPGSTPTPPPSMSPLSLINNGGFENGQTPWQESSAQGYQMVDPSNPHTGQYSAYLCGYMGCDDRLWQTFTVPAGYQHFVLTYWWYADTNKNTNQCLDTFTSQMQNSAGGVLRVLQQSCNTNATNAWVQESYDITGVLNAYQGKTVTLFFHGTNAPGQYQTSDFFIDDVTITATA